MVPDIILGRRHQPAVKLQGAQNKESNPQKGFCPRTGPTWAPLGMPGGRRKRLMSRTRAERAVARAWQSACLPEGRARPLPPVARFPEAAAGKSDESRGAGCGYREHAGRPAARARRVGFPAAEAAARGGSPVSGGRRPSARKLRRHVERPQLFYQLGGGRVRGVRGAYLLGHVWYRLYPSVLG